MAGKNKKRSFGMKASKILIVCIIGYIALQALPTLFGGASRVMTVEKDNFVDSISTEGVIIKKEEVFKAVNNGELEVFVEEGERIPAGRKIATLVSSAGSSAIEEELKQLDKSINELKKAREDSEKLTEGDNIEDAISSIEGEIQSRIRDGDYEDVYLLKERLNILANLDSNLEESNETIKDLEEKRNKLSQELTRNVKDYYSETGGIVTFKIDNKEELYPINDFEKYTFDKVEIDLEENESKNVLDDKNIEKDQAIFKLIDNFRWYMGIKIDDAKMIEDIKDRKVLSVKIGDNEKINVGKVININEFKNKAVIVLEFTKDLHDHYDKRFVKVELIKSDVTGFKIPKEAIIKKEDSEGVFIKDTSGIVRFRPVVIIGESEQNFYVKSGDENGNVQNDKGENITTITIFDEVFLNPASVKEGKIIK